uniref:Protein NLRC5-like n=1 Tax=Scleropages formosus TaxID=113540 RepID=A0A8C9TLD3_SCLFO
MSCSLFRSVSEVSPEQMFCLPGEQVTYMPHLHLNVTHTSLHGRTGSLDPDLHLGTQMKCELKQEVERAFHRSLTARLCVCWERNCSPLLFTCILCLLCSCGHDDDSLSGRGITNEVLQVLCSSLSKLRVSRQIVLANSSLTVDGLLALSHSLTTCSGIAGVKARLEEPPEVCVLFERGGETPGEKIVGRVPLLSKKLWLTHCSLHSAHMDRLFQTIAGCPQLTLLDLSNNTFGNNGLKKLLGLLPQLSSIQEINVSNNAVTVEGVLLLAETLRTCAKLKVVDVSHGGEQRIILKFHTSKSQQQVNNPEAPTTMENDLPLFKKLSLQQSCIRPGSMEELCRRLAQCGGLVQLDFSGGSLDRSSVEKLVKHLPGMTRLKVLNLSGNLLGDEGIRHFVNLLPDLHTLATVSLNNNNLTQTGALHLVRAMSVCAQLVAVEVSLGQEDRSVIQFAQSSACDLSQSLSLRECHFGADHLQKLADILVCCPYLGKVHMCCNKLPDELGVLLKALSKVNTLANLKIQNNALTPQVIEALLRDLHCNPRHLEIRVEEPWLKAEVTMNLISSCLNLNPNIQHIRVEETTLSITLGMSDYQGKLCTELSIPGADPVSVYSVQSIGLVDCTLQSQQLEVLRSICQRCPQLLELDLSHNSSGTELEPILSSLLPVLQNLTKLSLDRHVMDDHAAAVLAKMLPGLPKLCIISLSQCSGFTTVGACHLITALSHCHLLEDISLRTLQLQKEAMACLATGLHRMTSVKRLILSKVTMASGSSDKVTLAILPMLESLEQLRGIKVIELDELLMGEQGLLELVKHVPIWTGLRRISLCNNCITDDTGTSLVEALSHCMALEEIILSRNHLGDTSATHLGQVLPSLTHLRVLDLQMNCLQSAGAVSLISAFKDCRSLTDIVLSENQLGPLGIEKLSAALPHLCSLRKLHLVSVGTSDLSNLASSLGNCSYAEDISLAWNGVTDDVAVMLAEVFPLCQRLKRVDLEANSISVRGAKALAASVHCSASVQVIRLWKNPIPREEFQRLSEKEKRLSFSSM